MNRDLVKSLIIEQHLLPASRLRELEALALSSDADLLETILLGEHLKEEEFLPRLAAYFGIEWMDVDGVPGLDTEQLQNLPVALRESENAVPFATAEGSLLVAVADPERVEVLDDLRRATGLTLRPILSTRAKLKRARQRISGSGPIEVPEDATDRHAVDHSMEELASEAPIVKQVNMIIMQAISEGASDIHVEPYEASTVVRCRVDGLLHEVSTIPPDKAVAVVSRIKIMANLNIAEKRVPQDGRITVKVMDRSYDLRVATTPTLFGESVVMRILDKGNTRLELEHLGFSPTVLAALRRQLGKPHGILLVTGPTGSGKTTTLYSGLSAIRSPSSKIITIEDPVEYNLDGITQIHVNTAVGLTFAIGLRSILRLDPDVVMVGEIRDGETAEIAVRAALTGHLVLSTLHTNDAPSALPRLLDMGVAGYLLASSVNAVMSQRLVRRTCQFCRRAGTPPSEQERALFEGLGTTVDQVYRGTGCDECHGTGYSGRLGIHEIFEMSDQLRDLMAGPVNQVAVGEVARREGMVPMYDDGIRKAMDGQTTIEEVLRVTQQ